MKKQTSLTCNKVGNCSLLFNLDRRYKNKKGEYPIVITFTINYQRYYHRIGEFTTEKYFGEVCNVTSSKNSLMTKKKVWEGILEGYRARLVKVSSRQQLTLSLIRTLFSGVSIEGEEGKSFLAIWEDIISRKKEEGHAGTAESYSCALKSFRKIIGDINGFSVNKEIIKKWSEGMKNGVLQEDKIVGKIADATRGIYLRTCRVVWNECVRQGYLTEVEYPFSNKNTELVSIPRGKLRQKSYLTVDEMTELYNIFITKPYPEAWGPSYIDRVHQSLGLFLAQYLCNGCNLADIASLRYNKTYWQEGGKAFEFQRAKTAERSSDNSVVIVPIIEPLQRILDEIAAKPSKGGFVFPYIFNNVIESGERRKILSQENSNVRDRVQRICKEILNWEKVPSGTWARHSFATNLKLAGVEEEYIAESMGHSHGNDVTAGYMDRYPLVIRQRNNMKLLNTDKKEKPDLDKLSKAEMRALLEKFLA